MIAAEAPERIVVGEPRTLRGERGAQARSAAAFAARLRARAPVPVELWDERLTTVEARRRGAEARLPRRPRQPRRVRAPGGLPGGGDMSTRSRRPPSREGRPPRPRRSGGGGGRTLVWLGLIVVMVVAVGWALARGSFGDDDAPPAAEQAAPTSTLLIREGLGARTSPPCSPPRRASPATATWP